VVTRFAAHTPPRTTVRSERKLDHCLTLGIRLIQYLDSSAHGLVRRWLLIGCFPIHLLRLTAGGCCGYSQSGTLKFELFQASFRQLSNGQRAVQYECVRPLVHGTVAQTHCPSLCTWERAPTVAIERHMRALDLTVFRADTLRSRAGGERSRERAESCFASARRATPPYRPSSDTWLPSPCRRTVRASPRQTCAFARASPDCRHGVHCQQT
jgi:hypothetical protein